MPQKEQIVSDLYSAQRLIDEQKYDEALQELQKIMQHYPQAFRDAQEKVAIIIKILHIFNSKYLEVVNILSAGNVEKYERVITLIDEMQQMNPYANERIQQQLIDARLTAKIQIDRAARNEILQKAREELEIEQYNNAISQYNSGFLLQQDLFLRRGFPQDFVDSILNTVDVITKDSNDFYRSALQAGKAQENIIELFSLLDMNNIAMINNKIIDNFELFFTYYEPLSDIRKNLQKSANTILDSLNSVWQYFPQQPYDEYLSFLVDFLLGDLDNPGTEGIANITTLEIEHLLEPIFSILIDKYTVLLQQRDKAWQDGDFKTAENLTDSILLLYSYILKVYEINAKKKLARAGLVSPLDIVDYFTPHLSDEFLEKQLQYLVHQTQKVSIAKQLLYDKAYVSVTTQSVQKKELDAMLRMINLVQSMYREQTELKKEYESFQNIYEQSVSVLVKDDALQAFESQRMLLDTQVMPVLDEYMQKIYTIYDVILQNSKTEYNDAVEDIQALIDSAHTFSEGIAQDEAGLIVLYYPDKSIAQLQKAITSINYYLESIAQWRKLTNTVDDSVNQDVDIISFQENVDTVAVILREQLEIARKLKLVNETTIQKAQRLQKEGESILNTVSALITKKTLEKAQTRLNDSSKLISESLYLREQEMYRQQFEEKQNNLSNKISQLRTKIVVAQVREILLQAKNYYNNTNYSYALALIQDAEKLFMTISTEPNPEIVQLKKLIQAANSYTTQKVLHEADPMFFILASYLRLASGFYEQAVALFNKSKDKALLLLDKAVKNIYSILLLKPYNFDARLLEMNIVKLRDPEQFKKIFTERIRTIKTEIQQNVTNKQDLLTQIEVLLLLEPDEKQLKDIKMKLEIQLGLREAPINQADIRRARELFVQAKKLARTNDEIQLETALNLVEQSIQLNSNDTNVKIFADDIRIRLGGQASVSISSTDSVIYRRAENLFVAGKLTEALFLVSQLLQKERNKRYPPLQNLRKKIEFQL